MAKKVKAKPPKTPKNARAQGKAISTSSFPMSKKHMQKGMGTGPQC